MYKLTAVALLVLTFAVTTHGQTCAGNCGWPVANCANANCSCVPRYACPSPTNKPKPDLRSPEDVFADRLQPIKNAFPAGWLFSVVDEHAWAKHRVNTFTAFTDLGRRTTYVRMVFAVQSSPEKIQRILLHEAGHVACQCANEVRAERFAAAYIADHKS